MKKEVFLEELQDLFELENELIESSDLEIDSLDLLSLISFLDDNFNIQKSAEELQDINSVKDIIDLIGNDKLT